MSNAASTRNQAPKFIACGMYAFTDELQVAWRELFKLFIEQGGFEKTSKELSFETSEAILRDPGLLIGHTCGYPLMTLLADAVTPICVPSFNLPGCNGKYYSSHFIVNKRSHHKSLADCYQGIAAMNNIDSNSGMNLLRRAVAELSHGNPFFSEVRDTGSHITSFFEVADGLADVAAIDGVSFQLISDTWPDKAAKVRSIGFSEKTCGLPFVMPKSLLASLDKQSITAALNKATSELATEYRERLHLLGFEPVTIDDYQGVLELESYAVALGYPELR
jgi:ABC-type phosphate/phosphonate transport system substrate-binding protein